MKVYNMKNTIFLLAIISSFAINSVFAFTCPTNEEFLKTLQNTTVDQTMTIAVPYGNGKLESQNPISEMTKEEAFGQYKFAWAAIQLKHVEAPSFQKFQFHAACAYAPKDAKYLPPGAGLIVLIQYSPVESQLIMKPLTSAKPISVYKWLAGKSGRFAYCGFEGKKYASEECKFTTM